MDCKFSINSVLCNLDNLNQDTNEINNEGIMVLDVNVPYIETEDTQPVNILLIIDTSGSMYGEKIMLVLKSIEFTLSMLKPNDTFGIIQFDTESKILFPLQKCDLDYKTKIINDINKIKTGGTTNISSALITAYEHINEMKSNNSINRRTEIIFMTDGEQNEGITDSDKLIDLSVKLNNKCNDCSIHTLGFGEDVQDIMLNNISISNGGQYEFVLDSDKIPTAYGNCLGAALSVVYQKLEMKLSLHNKKIGNINTKDVLKPNKGYNFEQVNEFSVIRIDNIYNGFKKNILINVSIPNDIKNMLKYDNIQGDINDLIICDVDIKYFCCEKLDWIFKRINCNIEKNIKDLDKNIKNDILVNIYRIQYAKLCDYITQNNDYNDKVKNFINKWKQSNLNDDKMELSIKKLEESILLDEEHNTSLQSISRGGFVRNKATRTPSLGVVRSLSYQAYSQEGGEFSTPYQKSVSKRCSSYSN